MTTNPNWPMPIIILCFKNSYFLICTFQVVLSIVRVIKWPIKQTHESDWVHGQCRQITDHCRTCVREIWPFSSPASGHADSHLHYLVTPDTHCCWPGPSQGQSLDTGRRFDHWSPKSSSDRFDRQSWQKDRGFPWSYCCSPMNKLLVSLSVAWYV